MQVLTVLLSCHPDAVVVMPSIYSTGLYLNSPEGLGPAPNPRLYTWSHKNFILARTAVIDSLNLRPHNISPPTPTPFDRIYKETLKKKKRGTALPMCLVMSKDSS